MNSTYNGGHLLTDFDSYYKEAIGPISGTIYPINVINIREDLRIIINDTDLSVNGLTTIILPSTMKSFYVRTGSNIYGVKINVKTIYVPAEVEFDTRTFSELSSDVRIYFEKEEPEDYEYNTEVKLFWGR